MPQFPPQKGGHHFAPQPARRLKAKAPAQSQWRSHARMIRRTSPSHGYGDAMWMCAFWSWYPFRGCFEGKRNYVCRGLELHKERHLVCWPRLLHTNILQFFDAAQDKCKHSPHVRVSARLRCNTLCCASVFSSPKQLVVVSMSSRVRCCLEHDAEFSPITVILWQAPCVIVSEYCILGANLDVLMFDLADSVLR